MCNNLKNGSTVRSIPTEGVGYKVFLKGNKGRKTLDARFKTNRAPKGKWLKWKEEEHGDGFCFLLTLSDVEKFKRLYYITPDVIHKIQYKQGLGKRYEEWGYMSALCKEYKILEEVTL